MIVDHRGITNNEVHILRGNGESITDSEELEKELRFQSMRYIAFSIGVHRI
jgi:hypothetical protein